MDKQTLEHLPFFKGYAGSDVIIDPELFAQWLEHERADDELSPEEAARCDAAWADIQANPESAIPIEEAARMLGVVLEEPATCGE